jgi:hypothetical protein
VLKGGRGREVGPVVTGTPSLAPGSVRRYKKGIYLKICPRASMFWSVTVTTEQEQADPVG